MKNEMVLKALADCIAACNHCADACLEVDDISKMVDCIRTDRVCATVCTAVHHVLATGYTNVGDLVQVCIRICDECEKECTKHADMHDHCRQCAEACRRCAEACGRLAA